MSMQPTIPQYENPSIMNGVASDSVRSTDHSRGDGYRPRRSVHITNYYHQESGGVRANYDKLLRAADRHGRYISLIVPGETSHVETIGQFGRIYFVEAKRAPMFDRRYRVILPNQYLFNDSAVREVLLKEKPDFIEVYDNYSLVFLAGMTRMGYFQKLGRPMFVYFTGERFDTIFKTFAIGGRVGGWFSRRVLANFNLPMFDYYIANSRFVADEILTSERSENNPHRWEWFHDRCRRFFKALPEPINDRLAICPRGVNTSQFSPSFRSTEARKNICTEAKIPLDSRIVVSATRLSPEKNVRLLPEIMEKLAADPIYDFRLLVAGSGTEQGWLAEQSERFNGKMIIVGHLDRASLADLYSNADVFIHPNPREPFGNVGLEAMASGAPCVLPNSGGVLTYADDSNSWLVEPDAEGFYKGIKEAVEDEQLRIDKIKNAIETAVRNSEEAAIDRLIETYDRFFDKFLRIETAETRKAGGASVNLQGLHRKA